MESLEGAQASESVDDSRRVSLVRWWIRTFAGYAAIFLIGGGILIIVDLIRGEPVRFIGVVFAICVFLLGSLALSLVNLVFKWARGPDETSDGR